MQDRITITNFLEKFLLKIDLYNLSLLYFALLKDIILNISLIKNF